MSNAAKSWPAYHPQAIEGKWQDLWERNGLYRASEMGGKPKFYCLDFFPYPSGEGLHVGHCRNYVPTDVLSRFKRMQGYNVLHPMGWDAYGEPTGQLAITQGIQPRLITDRNSANFRRQMRLIGTSYDWSREIDSSRPEFYRWTQWFFLLMYRRGLAYRDTNFQWWCPTCQTTLSSHEVAGGVCWRGHNGVTRREIPAWYFKITAYADELLEGLDEVDWPDPIKTMQRNWIGRSEGVEIHFLIDASRLVIVDQGSVTRKDDQVTSTQSPVTSHPLTVFTTRPDTLYGVTFLVLAPEHPLVSQITTEERRAQVETYITESLRRSEVERMAEAREKTGVFTGGFVTHPLSGEKVPVWIADYVLPSYGTGVVMGVPAHDERDYEFAQKYALPVRQVIASPGESVEPAQTPGQAYTGPGTMINSGPFDGLPSAEGGRAIAAVIEEEGLGRRTVHYHMRDWLISRQNYWGTPIPIVYCQDCGEVPVPEDQLPVLLPVMEDFRPDGSGRSPLARLPGFVNTICPTCGGPAQRETDTLGGFACSSWYFLRFTSPHDDQGPFEPGAMRYWMPVDVYVGGAEHAVLHLLYARFWTRVLADAGLLPFREPFTKLLNQGQLMGPDGLRMSKSRGNVVTPDHVVSTHGADALRVYTMFLAPFEQDANWTTEGINGARRFLNRVWNLYAETYEASPGASEIDPALERRLQKTIRDVGERIERFRLNTMISALMEFANNLVERQREGNWRTATYHQALETMMVLLAPAAPHIAEELWSLTGHQGSVHQQPWPAWDAELAQDETSQVAVQVNGKVREVIEVLPDASQEEVQELAFARPKVQQHLAGKPVQRVIYVPGRNINLVT